MTRAFSIKSLGEISDISDPKVLTCGLGGLDSASYLRASSGDLVFLGGRPASGKTMLALQIAQAVSLHVPTLFFSLEMTGEQLKARIRKRRVSIAHSKLLICDDAGLTGNEICGIIDQVSSDTKLGLIVVDYIQIVQGYGRSKTEEIGAVVRELKALANELQVPVLLVAQLSREIDKRTAASEFAQPMMSDFADSAEIEKWADCCMILHKAPNMGNITKVYCVKNRHGNPTNFELKLNSHTLTFEDV